MILVGPRVLVIVERDSKYQRATLTNLEGRSGISPEEHLR
jgi:hypothetical protein